MDNPEYTFQILEVFSKIRTREIPRELEEYISYVARTGDPVFQWSLVKVLIKEKLLAVLDEFIETCPSTEIPPCPNVDPFNYETMKHNLLARLDSFILPPFTIQRICELLSAPRKEYSRIDKYMRAVEKNVLVVSASELSLKRGLEAEGNDAVINGILYGKSSDSLNNVTNHVFASEEQDNHLNVSNKFTETDAVQHIIDDSWTEETNDEFKLNGPGNSSLGVSFENELQFITDKTTEEKKSENCESKDMVSFDNNSMLIEPNLQNIIAESTNISFENVSKSEDNFETRSNAYDFKDDSQLENADCSMLSEKNLFQVPDDSNDTNVSAETTIENSNCENNAKENKAEYDFHEYINTKTDQQIVKHVDDSGEENFQCMPESAECKENEKEQSVTVMEFISSSNDKKRVSESDNTAPENPEFDLVRGVKDSNQESECSSGDKEALTAVTEKVIAETCSEVQHSEEPSPGENDN